MVWNRRPSAALSMCWYLCVFLLLLYSPVFLPWKIEDIEETIRSKNKARERGSEEGGKDDAKDDDGGNVAGVGDEDDDYYDRCGTGDCFARPIDRSISFHWLNGWTVASFTGWFTGWFRWLIDFLVRLVSGWLLDWFGLLVDFGDWSMSWLINC